MAEVASAYVTLIPSAKGFASGIQGQLGGQMVRAGQRGGVEFGGGMKTGFGKVAGGVFAAVGAVAAIAAIGLGKMFAEAIGEAITAGSDFQQAAGATDAVFKKNAKSIRASAEDAADSLGLPKTAYLELATVLGAGLKNKGVKDFAKSTQGLITVGADLAAQFGGSTQDAVDAIASAMRGESDPIERYGISLNETAINAELVAQGLKKGKNGFTEQQKTMARLALITKQSADAQGTFARESDTYAGSQQRLSASWDNIKTQVGTALLPAFTKLSQWFLTKGLPAVREFGNWVKDKLWPALKDGWESVQPGLEKAKDIILAAFGGESGKTMKDFGKYIVETLVPALANFINFELPQIAAGIAAVIEVVQALWDAFMTFRDIVFSVTGFMIDAFVTVNTAVADMLETMSVVPGFGWAKDAAAKLRTASDRALGLKDAINDIPSSKAVDITVTLTTNKAYQDFRSGERDAFGVVPGKRAKGGPVRAGDPYIVGEKGPELIVPRYHGNVIPNHQLGEGTAALGASAQFDYVRMGQTMADAVRQAPLAVGVEPVTRAVNRQVNQSAGRF